MSDSSESHRRQHRSHDSSSRKGSKRRHSKRKTDSFTGFGETDASPKQPFLVRATDFCLWTTVIFVALGFGGRAAVGQLFLAVGATLTTGFWLLHKFTSSESRYSWTGTEWLWCAGIAVAVCQIIPLPVDTLLQASPRLKEVIPLWFGHGDVRPMFSGWNRLSLAPGETESGLATFASYAMLYLVVAQRVRTIADAERKLHGVALASVAMGAFALLQYFTSNDKYFWFIDHPFMTTSHCALGCFTNRNHLAQFLALGFAPLVWWILVLVNSDSKSNDAGGDRLRQPAIILLMAGLGVTVMALLLCLSRGGLLALAVTAFVCFGLLYRLGMISTRLVVGLLVTGTVFGSIFAFVGYSAVESRLQHALDKKASDESRLVIWQANIDVAKDFPWIGTGIGTHADAYQLHFESSDCDTLEYTHAECGYLQVASESGMAGIGVALAFIVTGLICCFRGLWHEDSRGRMLAAVALASLLANVVHAAFDFFWYTPTCMLSLAIQLAVAVRLARSVGKAAPSADDDISESTALETNLAGWSFRVPRIITLGMACGLIAAASWMLDRKIPAALAEPDRMNHQFVQVHIEDLEEEAADEGGDSLLRAARMDPLDSRLQESAGIEYLRRFDALQSQSDSALTVGQVRDIIKASEFQTPQEMNDWLQRAVGSNLKLLHLARRAFRRSVQASPLRAYSYVKLSELAFLDAASSETETSLLNQALILRAHDPQVLYHVGRNVMLSGDFEGAMVYWREAFARSPMIQANIVAQLASQVTPDFFFDNLKPDWNALRLIARAYEQVGLAEDARTVWTQYVEQGKTELKATTSQVDLEVSTLAMFDAFVSLEEPERAIRVLKQGVQKLPQCYSVRSRLGWALYSEGRYRDAAEHLKWCAARRPGDRNLQQAAARAVKEGLRSAELEDSATSG